jgi:hypothetical protein
LILVGLQLHPGTVVPIYTVCLHVVLIVPGCVAFKLLVQNYKCTNLPRIYTVVHNLLCTTFTIILLIPISLILPQKIHFYLTETHSRIIIASLEYGARLKSTLLLRTSHTSLRICILYLHLPSPSHFNHVLVYISPYVTYLFPDLLVQYNITLNSTRR